MCFSSLFLCFSTQTNSIIIKHFKTTPKSSCNLNFTHFIFHYISFLKIFHEFLPKTTLIWVITHTQTKHNDLLGFVLNPNSITCNLNHESNLKGRIPCFSCTIWGFTHLTLNNFWVKMKSYQNPRKIKCQQEILVSKVVPHNPKTCIHTKL